MPMDFGRLITGGLDYASRSFSGYLLAIGVIGGLTMALLQAAKELTNWRKNFNRRKLHEWLSARLVTLGQHGDGSKLQQCVDEAEGELLRLATDRDVDAFYGA